MKKKKPIYDDNYYMFRTVVNSPTFEKKKRELYAHFASLGVPIPLKGFKTMEDLVRWYEELKLENIDSYGELDEIYKFYNIPKDNIFVRSSLMRAIYFDNDARNLLVSKPPMQIVDIVGDKEGLLFTIRVTDKTRKEDLDILWDRIDLMLYRIGEIPHTKNKAWENFEEDFELYKLSLEAKEYLAKRGITVIGKGKALPNAMWDIKEAKELKIELSESHDTIYKAIGRFERFIERTNLTNIL